MVCRGMLLIAVLFLGCKPTVNFQEVRSSDVESISFSYKNEDFHTIIHQDKIREFLNKFDGFSRDSTQSDFKSYWFISFKDSKSKSYRIEVFKNRFRFSGNKYLTKFDIEKYCKELHSATKDGKSSEK
jgi:hypothetical protein